MSAPMTKEEIVAYAQLVEVVRAGFNRLGRGSQQQAAFDIRVSPSLVSSVLNGRYTSQEILEKLEGWMTPRLTGLTADGGEEMTAGV